jgi:hypothetical protein
MGTHHQVCRKWWMAGPLAGRLAPGSPCAVAYTPCATRGTKPHRASRVERERTPAPTPHLPPASCITCIRDPRSKYVHGTWWVVVVYTTCGRPGEAGWRWRVGAQGNSRTKQEVEVASTAGSQPRFYTQKTPLAIQTPPPPSLSLPRVPPLKSLQRYTRQLKPHPTP